MRNKDKNIFIGMTEIAGIYSRLANGFRELGLSVTTVGLDSHKYDYEQKVESKPLVVKWYEKSVAFRMLAPRNKIFNRLFAFGFYQLCRFMLFCWAASHHDVFIFVFGTSLLYNNLDLLILRLLGKRIIGVLGHGSDARPPYINGVTLTEDGSPLCAKEYKKRTHKIKKVISRFELCANVVVGAPLTGHFFSKPFINWFALGIPAPPDTQVVSREIDSKTGDSVTIVHAPSRPVFKGSQCIRESINSLKRKGYNIRYVEVVDKPNSVVMRELQKCDFVIDQLYSDTPMAGFATEAATFNKPAVVGGYGWTFLQSYIDKADWPPSEICHPNFIESSIEKLISNVGYRKRLGIQAKKFVKSKWSFKQVAKNYLFLIDNKIPKHWWFDPSNLNYVHGAGMSEERVINNIVKIINRFDCKALYLSHNPMLEKAFIEFAKKHRDD